MKTAEIAEIKKETMRNIFSILGAVALNIAIIAYVFVFTGCATTSSTISNAKKNILINSLINQEKNERKKNMTATRISAQDIIDQEFASEKPSPAKGRNGVTFISKFTQKAIQFNPSLNYRKYTNTILSSKTGQTTTYSSDFSTINWALAGFLADHFYIKIKYLDMIIEEEAKKAGVGDGRNYIAHIVQGMLTYGAWGAFVANTNSLGNKYLKSLELITYRAIALYELSDKSPKIATIVYHLQTTNLGEVDNIVAKKHFQIAQQKADRINQRDYAITKNSVLAYRNINVKDLNKNGGKGIQIYYKLLPKEILKTRKKEVEEIASHFINFCKENGLNNGLQILEKIKNDKAKINNFNITVYNNSDIMLPGYLLIDQIAYSDSCVTAGFNSMISYSAIYRAKYLDAIDILAYNVGVMQDLKCPETYVFKDLLKKVIKVYR